MTPEEKELLFKDITARLPYQPMCEFTDTEDDFCKTTEKLGYSLRDFVAGKIIIKPYLRPMSSMTEDEKRMLWEELDKDTDIICENLDAPIVNTYNGRMYRGNPIHHEIDFLNKNHFDWRGLIPMGLALEAPEGMYNTKNRIIMTQEEKQLLLKDICSRLPYKVKGKVYAEVTDGRYDMMGDMIFYYSPFDVILDGTNVSTEEIHVVAIGNKDTVEFIEMQQTDGAPYTIDDFKPYLRPLSSMTVEEMNEFFHKLRFRHINFGSEPLQCVLSIDEIEWLNQHHFDYRDLIGKGLAIEAPEGMYNTKTE